LWGPEKGLRPGRYPSRTELDDWFNGGVVVLEPRGFRATSFDILDDVNAGKILEIAAHSTFVLAQLISKGANRTRAVVLQVVDQVEATVLEDILRTLPGEDERVQESVLCERFRERGAKFQTLIGICLLAHEVVRAGGGSASSWV